MVVYVRVGGWWLGVCLLVLLSCYLNIHEHMEKKPIFTIISYVSYVMAYALTRSLTSFLLMG